MLIVDSPFPPYKPVEYVFKGVPADETKDTCWSDEPEIVAAGLPKPELIATPYSGYSTWQVDGKASRSDGRPSRKEYMEPEDMERWVETEAFEAGDTFVHSLYWKQEGKLHRDGDLPADISETEFYKTYSFLTMGVMHRFDDAGIVEIHKETEELSKFFLLYGAELDEDKFFKVHTNAIKFGVPLWLATCELLFNLDFETHKTAEEFRVLSTVPVEWALQTLGLGSASWKDASTAKRQVFGKIVDPIKNVTDYEKRLYVNR